MTLLLESFVILILLAGIGLFREPRRARFGNLAAALALLCATALVLFDQGIIDGWFVIVALGIGALAGYGVAKAVDMTQIPAMVAVQNGAGGAAACLVALVELTRGGQGMESPGMVSGIVGIAVGAFTFSGSMIAGIKLTSKKWQTPRALTGHNTFMAIGSAALLTSAGLSIFSQLPALTLYLVQILLATGLGILFAIRVGGADMPVLISFLNAMTGLAAALCGMVIDNRMLIAFGATVAASGSVLTLLMCRAMNRRLINVFLPELKMPAPVLAEEKATAPVPQSADEVASLPVDAAGALSKAKKVIIIPGYGMALSKAQFKVVELATLLSKNGIGVKFAIHPVAGRMPGHMNVILAEADVDYDDLIEMEEANPLFAQTDVALIVGACDVVNPSAINVEGTPISGMPILAAHEAGRIIICNFDRQPGYSGVPNPLYENSKTILLAGDAKTSLAAVLDALEESKQQSMENFR